MNTAKMTDDLIKRGVRQREIAEYCGVNQSTVSRWRKGIDPEGPSRDRLAQLYEQTFGADPLIALNAGDDAALREKILQMFDRIRDPKLKLVAVRQVGALADQESPPPLAGSDE